MGMEAPSRAWEDDYFLEQAQTLLKRMRTAIASGKIGGQEVQTLGNYEQQLQHQINISVEKEDTSGLNTYEMSEIEEILEKHGL